jgi:hypothetical protein
MYVSASRFGEKLTLLAEPGGPALSVGMQRNRQGSLERHTALAGSRDGEKTGSGAAAGLQTTCVKWVDAEALAAPARHGFPSAIKFSLCADGGPQYAGARQKFEQNSVGQDTMENREATSIV